MVDTFFAEQIMRGEQQDIPQQVVTFFNEVNPYIEILPADFKKNLREYMHLLAWQITENNHIEFPDEDFYSIRRKFIAAKSSVLH